MPGQKAFLFIFKEIKICEHIFPVDTQLEVFSHGESTKIHYKDENNITQRTEIPLHYDLVYEILAKWRTDLIPQKKV